MSKKYFISFTIEVEPNSYGFKNDKRFIHFGLKSLKNIFKKLSRITVVEIERQL